MDVLWERAPATAEQVRAALPDEPHDSTVRTLLRVLESKGYVEHETRGKAYHYRSTVPRRRAQSAGVRSFLERLFGGSAESLVLHLLEDEVLTPTQLKHLQRKIDPRRRKGGSS